MADVIKLRNKRTGLFFNKGQYSFGKGTKFTNLKTIRRYIDVARNLAERDNPTTNPYTNDDFEIVEFEMVEVGIAPNEV